VPFLQGDVFLADITLVLIGAMESITSLTLELKPFTRSSTGAEARDDDDVKA